VESGSSRYRVANLMTGKYGQWCITDAGNHVCIVSLFIDATNVYRTGISHSHSSVWVDLDGD
jgi:hypothetical protein